MRQIDREPQYSVVEASIKGCTIVPSSPLKLLLSRIRNHGGATFPAFTSRVVRCIDNGDLVLQGEDCNGQRDIRVSMERLEDRCNPVRVRIYPPESGIPSLVEVGSLVEKNKPKY